MAEFVSSQLLELLVCPRCHGELRVNEQAQALDCENCRLRYAVTDGIPVMLIDEAESF